MLLVACTLNQKVSLLKPRPKHTPVSFDQIYRCSLSKKKEIYIGNTEHYSYFQEMINRLKKDNINLSNIEKFTLWALSQSLLKPNYFSPDAHTILITNYKKTTHLFHSQRLGKKEKQFGFYETLKFLLKRYKSQRTLKSLIKIFDEHYPYYITAGKDLSEFLVSNKEKLEENRDSFPLYFRGEDLLLSNESYRRPFLAKAFTQYEKLPLPRSTVKDLKLLPSGTKNLNCNIDIKPYLSGSIAKKIQSADSYYIGYSIGSFHILLSAQTSIDWKKEIAKNNFFNSNDKNTSPLCVYKTNNLQIVLSSHNGKDPAQTLSHFFRYGIEELETRDKIYNLTNFARHLILRNPTRILYESQRGTPEQLENLNSLNIPIYHSKSIGQVTGLLQSSNNSADFLLDDRSSIRENCPE